MGASPGIAITDARARVAPTSLNPADSSTFASGKRQVVLEVLLDDTAGIQKAHARLINPGGQVAGSQAFPRSSLRTWTKGEAYQIDSYVFHLKLGALPYVAGSAIEIQLEDRWGGRSQVYRF